MALPVKLVKQFKVAFFGKLVLLPVAVVFTLSNEYRLFLVWVIFEVPRHVRCVARLTNISSTLFVPRTFCKKL
jgi:hypothetical protein